MPDGKYVFYAWSSLNQRWIGYNSYDAVPQYFPTVFWSAKTISGKAYHIYKVGNTKTYVAFPV